MARSDPDNGTQEERFALAYHDSPSREWWYIPTVPEGRNWRGPMRDYGAMMQAAVEELGAAVSITDTTVRPRFLEP